MSMGFAPAWLHRESPLLHKTTLTTVLEWVNKARSCCYIRLGLVFTVRCDTALIDGDAVSSGGLSAAILNALAAYYGMHSGSGKGRRGAAVQWPAAFVGRKVGIWAFALQCLSVSLYFIFNLFSALTDCSVLKMILKHIVSFGGNVTYFPIWKSDCRSCWRCPFLLLAARGHSLRRNSFWLISDHHHHRGFLVRLLQPRP